VNFLVWNVRGLNSRARRKMVADLVFQEHVSVVCLQETKISVFDDRVIQDEGFQWVATGFSSLATMFSR
jgi:exonuclease III